MPGHTHPVQSTLRLPSETSFGEALLPQTRVLAFTFAKPRGPSLVSGTAITAVLGAPDASLVVPIDDGSYDEVRRIARVGF